MLRPGTGESTSPRMGLLPGVAGSPGRGGSNGAGAAAGAVSAFGGADVAVRVDDGAVGCGAQGSAAAGFGAAEGLLGGIAMSVAGSAAVLGGVSVLLFAGGFLSLASRSRTCTMRMGKGFGGGS